MNNDEKLEDFIKLLSECKTDDTCLIMIPAIIGYDVYRVPQNVARTAMKLHEYNESQKIQNNIKKD